MNPDDKDEEDEEEEDDDEDEEDEEEVEDEEIIDDGRPVGRVTNLNLTCSSDFRLEYTLYY